MKSSVESITTLPAQQLLGWKETAVCLSSSETAHLSGEAVRQSDSERNIF